jgi:hypothetical protein
MTSVVRHKPHHIADRSVSGNQLIREQFRQAKAAVVDRKPGFFMFLVGKSLNDANTAYAVFDIGEGF